MRSLRPLLSAILFLPLLAFSLHDFTVMTADAAGSALEVFSLSGAMTFSGGAETGVGQFKNGNAGAYLETTCVPFLVTVPNTSASASTISTDVYYDYAADGSRIDDLQTITSSLTDVGTATNLNNFAYPGTSFSAATTAKTASGASLVMSVTGPVLDSSTLGHYTATVTNIPAHTDAQIIFCALLGRDSTTAPGSSMSVRLGSGGGAENVPITASDIVELPSLTITKIVSSGSALPDQWSFIVTPGVDGVSPNTVADIIDGQTSITLNNVRVSSSTTFTITETGGPVGYAFESGLGTNCSFVGSTATATVVPSDPSTKPATAVTNASCTFTNAAVPATLTVIKNVVNDNGGTLTAGDFQIHVTDATSSTATFSGVSGAGTTLTMDPGSFTVSEDALSSYAGSMTGDCSGTIAFGDHLTCTITNDDIAPTLTVYKHVDNTAGGTLGASNFTMVVTGTNVAPFSSFPGDEDGNVLTLNAGSYSVDEAAASPDYVKTLSADCSGTIALGESKSCTVTNTYTPAPTAQVTVTKELIVDDGGDSEAGVGVSNFPLSLTDGAGVVTSVTSGVPTTLVYGTYTVSETDGSGYAPGYTATFSGDCTDGIIVVDASKTSYSCTITNNDNPPAPAPTAQIRPILQCVMPNDTTGYTAYWGYDSMNAGDTYIAVGPSNSLSGGGLIGIDQNQPVIFQANSVVNFSLYPNYAFTTDFDGASLTWSITVGSSSLSASASSTSELCIKPAPGTLKVTTEVNSVLLSSTPSDTTMSVTGGTNVSPSSFTGVSGAGVTVTMDGGSTYSVLGSDLSGYSISYSPDCTSLLLSAGETKFCTVTYNEDPIVATGTLVVIKHVINDNAGIRLAPEFQMIVTGTNVSTSNFAGSETGVTVNMDPGSYSVTEDNAGGYTATFSADCSGTIAAGETKTCTITNDDQMAGGSGGTQSAGSGNGGGSSTTTTPPAGQVLGDTDSNTPVVEDPADPATPTGEVLGATDEQLPRTGFPVEAVELMIGSALFYATRPRK